MSLDVYLSTPACPTCGRNDELFHANITHNLSEMAGELGIYPALWCPEAVNVTCAADLIVPLTAAIEKMQADPEHWQSYDSPNGWGLAVNFLPWLVRYRAACLEHPKSVVTANR